MRTFAELFCQQHHIPAARFALTLFWLCLHRRALIIAPILLLLNLLLRILIALARLGRGL